MKEQGLLGIQIKTEKPFCSGLAAKETLKTIKSLELQNYAFTYAAALSPEM